MTVAITRTELDAAGLRAAATRCKDAAAARRMLALALVMEGHSRSEAARAAGMDRQTLGAASICVTRSPASSAYSCTNAPSASCWRG